jgi:hypothetical protein
MGRWTQLVPPGRMAWASDFRVEPGETLAGLLSYYAETAALTERVIAGVTDLSQPQAADPERSVRWVLLHLIKETARHAGHADLIREALDGRRAGELDQAYDAGLAQPAAAGGGGGDSAA